MTKSTAQISNTSRSSLLSFLSNLDVVSNNIANLNTIAFKGWRGNFQELLSNTSLAGVQLRATQMDAGQGVIQLSSSPLHAAIQGNGFFTVTLANGTTAYTRDGQFALDSARNIVDSNGNRLVWQGAIPADFEDVRINTDGTVFTRVGTVWTQSGTISLTRFPNPSGLVSAGQNLYTAGAVAGAPVTAVPGSPGMGSLVGGALESSNVNLTEEMTEMITLQRGFQINSAILSATGGMLDLAVRMRR